MLEKNRDSLRQFRVTPSKRVRWDIEGLEQRCLLTTVFAELFTFDANPAARQSLDDVGITDLQPGDVVAIRLSAQDDRGISPPGGGINQLFANIDVNPDVINILNLEFDSATDPPTQEGTVDDLNDIVTEFGAQMPNPPGGGAARQVYAWVITEIDSSAQNGPLDVSVSRANDVNHGIFQVGDPTDQRDLATFVGDSVNILREAELELSKADFPDPVIAGDLLTYDLTVTNNGPFEGTNVTLVDTLPPEVLFQSASTGCIENNGTVTCDFGTLDNGTSNTVSITVLVPASVADGAVLTNAANVSADEPDPDSVNNDAIESTTVIREADLRVFKSGSPDPVIAGDSLSYTIDIQNLGPSDASNVIITDALPSDVSFVSSSAGCSEDSGTVTCNLGDLPVGNTSVQIDVLVASSAPDNGSLLNTVTATADETDPFIGDNTTEEFTTVIRNVDLSVAKIAIPDPAIAGQSLTYEITVTNGGLSDASNVVLTDFLPSGVSFDSASAGCVESSGTVTCNLGTLAPGSVTVQIDVTVPSSTASGSTLLNDAVVTSDELDTDTSNNQTNLATTVERVSDLELSKTDSIDPVLAGEVLSYDLTVLNNGPSDASGIVLVDTLPLEVVFLSASAGCSESAGTVTCDLGTLAPGSTVVQIDVTVPSSVPDDTLLDNMATVSANEIDSDPNNNATNEETTVDRQSDLELIKVDSVDPVLAGAGLSYTLTVNNLGPSDSSTVVVSDGLPADVSFISATAGQGICNESGGVVTCDLGDVISAASIDIEINVLVSSAASGQLSNTASVSGDSVDINSINDVDTELTDIIQDADLAVSKTDSADPVNPLDTFFYNMIVNNNGISDATGVVLIDTLPAGLDLVSATPDQGVCFQGGNNVTCNLGDLAAGGQVNVEFEVTPPLGLAGQTIQNTALVTSGTPDSVSGNNTASEDTDISEITADLEVEITDDPDPVDAGHSLLLSVEVTNNGPLSATGVVLSTELPAGLSPSSVNPNQGNCDVLGSLIECTISNLPVGDSATVEIDVDIPLSLPGVRQRNLNSTTLTTVATAAGSQIDPVGGNNRATEATRVNRLLDHRRCNGNVRATVRGRTLVVTGDRGNNCVTIEQNPVLSRRTARTPVNLVLSPVNGTTLNGSLLSQQFSGINNVSANMNAGNDDLNILDAAIAGYVKVDTKAGNDRVLLKDTSVGRQTRVRTGSGHDQLFLLDSALRGRGRIETHSGNDSLLTDGSVLSGRVDIRTGSGSDTVDFTSSEFNDIVTLITGGGKDSVDVLDSVFLYMRNDLRAGDDLFASSESEYIQELHVCGGRGTDEFRSARDRITFLFLQSIELFS